MEKTIELLENKNFTELRTRLNGLKPQDIALIFNDLETDKMIVLFRILPKDKAVDTFAEMDSDLQEELIKALTDKELKEVIDELFTDDTVDLIEEMPSNVVKRILKTITPAERKIINEFLNYPDYSAGSIMTNEFVDLKENMTIDEAFEKIKRVGEDKENIYNCYVLTETRRLIGRVTVRDMILANKTDKIKDIMVTELITANTLENQETVSRRMKKYALTVLPVVDKEERLVGIITIDDAMLVLEEEITEDFHKMAAITPNEDSYFKTPVLKHARSRVVWLLFLLLSAMVTGKIITNYENAFAAVPLLVAFIPMLMGTGGNCGSQAATLIIRGLAVDEIKTKDLLKAVWKEVRVALLVGVMLALIMIAVIMFLYKDILLAITISITLIIVVMMAKLLGCTLPILAKKLKMDPALMASPLITTIVDTCSVLIYFNIATMIMNLK